MQKITRRFLLAAFLLAPLSINHQLVAQSTVHTNDDGTGGDPKPPSPPPSNGASVGTGTGILIVILQTLTGVA